MQLLKTFLAASVELSASLLIDAPVVRADPTPTRLPSKISLDRRGPIQDIVRLLQSRKATGQAVCTSFLDLPPYAATRTITVTDTIAKTIPVTTTTRVAGSTLTASAKTVFDTKTVVVAITPTVSITLSSPVPFTSTVATVTSFATSTTTDIITVTNFEARAAQPTHCSSDSMIRNSPQDSSVPAVPAHRSAPRFLQCHPQLHRIPRSACVPSLDHHHASLPVNRSTIEGRHIFYDYMAFRCHRRCRSVMSDNEHPDGAETGWLPGQARTRDSYSGVSLEGGYFQAEALHRRAGSSAPGHEKSL
ncbi:hypothetical protein V8E36_005217 [Tilletia maclaganii]